MVQRFALPLPWGVIELFDLTEQVEETDSEVSFKKTLFLVNPRAKGGAMELKSTYWEIKK